MLDFLKRWLKPDQAAGPEPAAASSPTEQPEPVVRRVLMITHAPVVQASRGGSPRSLRAHFGWNDPEALARAYIDDVRWSSHGYANYEIVSRETVEAFPTKVDGFAYDGPGYLRAWQTGRFHQPDTVDYLRLVQQHRILERVAAGTIDEVWLFGFPYAGYYESIMAGPGAFWCNAPPLAGTVAAGRRFVIMGFSYERGVGEMLEDLGHRTESIMSRVFAGLRGEANLFERFTRYEQTHPGRAECGNVHFAPNSQADYDWGNPRTVWSRCDNWYNFPDLHSEPRRVDARAWGGGDMRGHHRWWLHHLPHVVGQTRGISWNWWEYILDPQLVGD